MDVSDIDGDGVQEVLLAGINNGCKSAVPALLYHESNGVLRLHRYCNKTVGTATCSVPAHDYSLGAQLQPDGLDGIGTRFERPLSGRTHVFLQQVQLLKLALLTQEFDACLRF